MYSKENLTKLKKMNEVAPEVMKAFWAFDKAAIADGAISVKYKEIIAFAVALTTQCPYCIEIHGGQCAPGGRNGRGTDGGGDGRGGTTCGRRRDPRNSRFVIHVMSPESLA
jgi:AhpD family alkylhydroperoxidase